MSGTTAFSSIQPPWVVVDVEASGKHPDDGARVASVGLAWLDQSAEAFWKFYDDGTQPPVVTYAFAFDQGARDKFPSDQPSLWEEEDPNQDEEFWNALLHWLSKQNLVFHNGKYDVPMLKVGTRHWPGRDLIRSLTWDTMIAQRVLDPKFLVGLSETVRRLGLSEGKTERDALKGWLRKHKYPVERYDLVPWEIVKPYLLGDVRDTALLYALQQARLLGKAPDFDDDSDWPATEQLGRIERQLDLLRALYAMETRGVGYDGTESLKAAEMLEQRAQAIEDTMPFKADVNSAKKYFFEKRKLIPDRRTEKRGDPVLDEEQTRVWIDEGVRWAREYADVTRARRAVSMWYRGYPEKMGQDGRLRTVYKQTQVKSGRMSVERVQLQAMPKGDKYSAVGSTERLEIYEGVPDVRSLLQARDGHGVWNLDLSQAELRVASKYSGCAKMLKMVLGGGDAHGHTTETVLRTPRDDPHFKYRRDIGKRLNFAAVFMVGGQTFQENLSKLANIHLTVDECDELIWRWRREYPEFEQAYYASMREVKRKGYVRVLPNTEYEIRSYFKIPGFGEFEGKPDWERTAWNRKVQGSLAEFFSIWMAETEKRWPGYMILSVHDSLLLEAPLDEGDQLAREVAAWGANAATELFKLEMKVDTDRYV